MLDDETKNLLDTYCKETHTKFSDAFRLFIREGVSNFNQKKDFKPQNNVNSEGLSLNEKRGIKASIESLMLLRELANEISSIRSEVSRVDKNKINVDGLIKASGLKADEILKNGWSQ